MINKKKIIMIKEFNTRKIMTIFTKTGKNLEELKELIIHTIN